MKNFIGNCAFLFFTFLLLHSTFYGQNSYTYGPIRETHFGTSQGNTPENWNVHYVGQQIPVEYICFVNWQWNSSSITKFSRLTSINLKFKAADQKAIERPTFPFSIHKVETNWGASISDWGYYYNQIYYNDNRKVYSDVINNINGVLDFNKTITSGPLFDAIQAAITSGNNYITLAFKSDEKTAPAPYWIIYPYDATMNESYYGSNNPSIDLTLNFTSIPQNYQFVNNIEGTETSGMLNVKDNIAGTSSSITSGSVLGLDPMLNFTARTNELPFLANWNSTENTEKHNYWIDPYNKNQNSLTYTFVPQQSGDLPLKLSSKFDRTNSATIQATTSEGITGTTVSLRDPWYYYSDGQNNWYQSDEFKSYNSPLLIQKNSSGTYGGVFLNQDPSTGSNPYYSVSFPSTSSNQSVNINGINHQIYFINWSASPLGSATIVSPNSASTPVIFKSEGATVTANIKASMLSNSSTAFSNSSQRKLACTPNGSLHLVYESMGKVWYEKSTDNGTTWRIMNGGRPLVSDDAKLPSIEAYDSDSRIFITYQKRLENGFPPDSYLIELMVYNVDVDSPQDILQVWQSYPYSYNANPVVAFDCNQEISDRVAVAFQDNSEEFTGSLPGILYRLAGLNSTGMHYEWKTSATRVNGTDGNSVNPSIKSQYYIATVSKYNPDLKFHIAFEQRRSTSGSAVKYSLLTVYQPGLDSTSSFPPDVSSLIFPTPTDLNEKPLVTVVNGVPYISWLHYSDWTYLHEAALARNTGGSWNLFNRYGKEDDITSVHMNNVGLNGFVLAWNVDGYGNEFVRSTSMSTPYFTNTTGRYIQVANGTDFTNTRLISFMNDAVPYYFTTSNPMSTGTLAKGTLSKETGGQNVSRTVESRTGIIKINGASFRASLGEIKAGESDVMFKEIEKDFTPGKKSFLRALESMEFEVSDKTILSYMSEFTFNDSAKTVFLLQGDLESLSFSLELVDVRSGEVLKKLSSKTFNGNSVVMGKPQAFRLDLNGIGSRTVKLRISYDLKAKNSLITEYILLNSYRPESSLKKENYVDLSYSEVKPVTEYGLSQNYPNPFNPSTVINYQIPKASKVMLKIYDMLGKEVTTLVNEYKEQGRYSVEFNASNLPSGTYIYEIRANNFVKSGKMMLLK